MDPLPVPMQCTSCGALNQETHKFCSNCGAPLGHSCPRCRSVNPPEARFCGGCSLALTAPAPQETPSAVASSGLDEVLQPVKVEVGERKIVTALFADIKDSVALIVDMDAEEAQEIVDPALRLMGEVIRAHGGYIVQTLGDGVFAVFGAPQASQDHPRQAIHAALAMQSRLAEYSRGLRERNRPELWVRIGLNTGEVVMRSLETGGRNEYAPIGHAVNVAARLQAAAPAGSIAIGERTRQLVEGYFQLRPLDSVSCKGIRDPVEAYEVRGLGSLRRRLQVSMMRGLSRFVGREREMRALEEALAEVHRGRGRIVSIVAEAGGGKSRLLHEFTRTVPQEWRVLEAFAASHAVTSAWMPVVALLQEHFGLTDSLSIAEARSTIRSALRALDPALEEGAPYLFSLLGLAEDPDPLAEMNPLVRRERILEVIQGLLATESRRQPLVFIFEDLHWIDAQSRLLLDRLVASIEDLSMLLLVSYRPEFRNDWLLSPHHREIPLQPLAADQAQNLLASLLRETEQRTALTRQIIDKTGGNPFFMEEIVHALHQVGLREGAAESGPVGALGVIELPATVHAAIAERIDKLPFSRKLLLQLLAVVGVRSPLELIAQLVKLTSGELRQRLADLQAADFIYLQNVGAQEICTFKHALTQEVAYGSLLKERRQHLHDTVARVMERLYADRIGDHISQLAYHYSRSPNTAKAVEYLGRAGELSIQRSAHTEAAENLRLALQLLAELPGSEERVAQESRLWLALGVSLQTSLGYAATEVGVAYEKARLLAERSGDPLRIISAVRGQSIFCIVRADYDTAFRLGEALLLHDDGSPENAIERRMILGLACLYTGRLAESEAHFLEAVGSGEEHRSVHTIQYSGHSSALCLSYLALSVWYLGDAERALYFSRRGLELAERLGIPITLAQARGMYGLLCHTARDYRTSEVWMDRTIAYADSQGFPYWSTLGRILKSWLVAERCGSLSAIDDFAAGLQAYRGSGARIGLPWFLTMQAEMLARFGRFEQALASLDDAFFCLEDSQERYHEAELLRVKGEVLLAWRDLAVADLACDVFNRSLQVARDQSARSIELRAACSQARLSGRLGRAAEGAALLEPVLGRFSEGFAGSDLQEARMLFQRLRGEDQD